MPRGKELTELKVRKIWFLIGTGISICRVTKEIRRSKITIKNVIKHGINGTIQKRTRAKSKLC